MFYVVWLCLGDEWAMQSFDKDNRSKQDENITFLFEIKLTLSLNKREIHQKEDN